MKITAVALYGITDPARFDQRAPTVAFTLEGYTPRQVAERLGQAGIFVWDLRYYALAVTERLGVEESGGMVRVGTDVTTRWGKLIGSWLWSMTWLGTKMASHFAAPSFGRVRISGHRSILSLSKDAAPAPNLCKPAPFDRLKMLISYSPPKSNAPPSFCQIDGRDGAGYNGFNWDITDSLEASHRPDHRLPRSDAVALARVIHKKFVRW